MAKNKRSPGTPGIRRQLLNHPLLRKGGAHQQTAKAKRQQDKIKLRREWPQVSASRLPVATSM